MMLSNLCRKAVSAAVFCLVFSSCIKDKVTKTFTIQRPVYATKASILAGISAGDPVAMSVTGKIYYYNNWIFMNEPGKGIHIFDNSNPAFPTQKAFIKLPGNIDLAVKGNIVYADLYTDMLAIDIANPLNPQLKKLVPNVFPDRLYTNGYLNDTSRIIVDWITKDTVVEVNEGGFDPGWGCPNCEKDLVLYNASSNSNGGGQGGSMARFAIVSDYLYSVSSSFLSTHDISNESDPVSVHTIPMGWNIETVYPFRDKLFIGSATGMFIADISKPDEPSISGQFQHARACDPVVADDQYAYVTLRTGTRCDGTQNQLDILDVTNVQSPKLIKTFLMTNPHGLGIKGDFIYLCDGSDGLKVFDAKNKMAINEIQRMPVKDATDVIIRNNLLILVAGKGIYQYSIAEDGKLSLLSTIKTN
jgi:hypothetical protein